MECIGYPTELSNNRLLMALAYQFCRLTPTFLLYHSTHLESVELELNGGGYIISKESKITSYKVMSKSGGLKPRCPPILSLVSYHHS